VVTLAGKTRERIRTHNGSKRVKSGKDVPFGGFVKKWLPPPPTSPQILKMLHYRSRFSLKTSPTKFRIGRGNSLWGFQNWG